MLTFIVLIGFVWLYFYISESAFQRGRQDHEREKSFGRGYLTGYVQAKSEDEEDEEDESPGIRLDTIIESKSSLLQTPPFQPRPIRPASHTNYLSKNLDEMNESELEAAVKKAESDPDLTESEKKHITAYMICRWEAYNVSKKP